MVGNSSQQWLWEKFEKFGIRGRRQCLGFNAYAGRTRRTRTVNPVSGERKLAAKRGHDARGRLLPGWVLLPCGIATYQG